MRSSAILHKRPSNNVILHLTCSCSSVRRPWWKGLRDPREQQRHCDGPLGFSYWLQALPHHGALFKFLKPMALCEGRPHTQKYSLKARRQPYTWPQYNTVCTI